MCDNQSSNTKFKRSISFITPISEFCFKTELTQSLMARDDVKMNQWLAAWSENS